MNDDQGTGSRRDLKSPRPPWAQALARRVCAWGVTPNTVSVLGLVFSLLAAVCLMKASEFSSRRAASGVWLGAAACIQLRLLCNLLYGIMEIEGGSKRAVGGLYNEALDCMADPLLLMAAGYCNDWVVKLGGIPLGWVAAVLSVLTACIRLLGGTLTGIQSFIGPMARPHRMAVLTAACLGSIAELWVRQDGKCAQGVMRWALALIVAGSVITCWRRLKLIAGQLQDQESP